MTEEKRDQILSDLEGITYMDWQKLKHAVDVAFSVEVNSAANKVPFSRLDIVKKEY